jgi:hypothetical protein
MRANGLWIVAALISTIICLTASAHGTPVELRRPEQVASYTLSARLDVDTHTVTATGSVRFKNTSERPLQSIWLHLYLNAFKSNQTLFLRSPFVRGRGGGGASEFGHTDIKRLLIPELSGKNLLPQLARHSPGDPADQTDLELKLPSSIAPGQTVTIELEFASRLPQIVERTGHSSRFYLVAQWFPKLARLEPDGTWKHFAFHPQSEFYADYGRYSVTIDVPENMLVGATGRRVEERTSAGRRVVRHEIDSVHDFAWSAWDRFRERVESVDGTEVRLLHPPGHARNAAITLDTLRFALPHFSRRYGAYPYPVLTVVHPPEHAKNAGGMEYPTLITTGGRWFTSLVGARSVEAVTVHELGHQWFYGLLASNERAWPFLDEGLTSYAESVALTERFGHGSLFSFAGIQLSETHGMRALAAAFGRDEPVAQPAPDFSGFTSLGALVYGRTATILETIAKVWGAERLERAFAQYTQKYRFLHPNPQQFLAEIDAHVGRDAAAFAQRALFERGFVDFLTKSVETTRAAEPAGEFDDDGGRHLTAPHPPSESSGWHSRVIVVRRGSLELPVEVDLIDDDGNAERRSWDGRGAWTAFEHRGPRPIVAAIVDPERRVLLDDNLLNNAASREPPGVDRVTERATYLAQLLLALIGP